MISKFTFRLLAAAIALSPALLVNAQSKPFDSVIVKFGSRSRIVISIGDRGDVAVLRRYDVEGLIDDLIQRIEDRETKLPPATRYSADSLVNAAREQADRAARELEKEIEAMERDLPRDDSRNQHMERMKDISAALERLSRLQERLAKEQAERASNLQIRTIRGNEWLAGDNDKDDKDEGQEEINSGKRSNKRTTNSFNVDFGINNYLSDGKFIDAQNLPYTVRPLGSWFIAFSSTNRTRIAKKVFLEWGPNTAFYNFKFLSDDVRVTKSPTSVDFSSDNRSVDHIKSKLTAYYGGIFLVPVIDFGGHSRKPGLSSGYSSGSFRFGLGPYLSTRIDSYAKQVFKEDGERQRERNHDNFYLNNIRYGLRLQVGFRDTDLFVNYDLDDLFAPGKAPALNAFSFGISF